MKKEKKLRCFDVRHPKLGVCSVLDVRDKLEAVQRAAKAWGGIQWSRLARECQIVETSHAVEQ